LLCPDEDHSTVAETSVITSAEIQVGIKEPCSTEFSSTATSATGNTAQGGRQEANIAQGKPEC